MLCCAAHTRTHKQTQTQTNTNTHRHTAPCALFCSCLALAVCTGFVAEGVYWLFQRSPGRVFHIIVSTATTRVSSPVTPRWPLIQPPPLSLSRAHTRAHSRTYVVCFLLLCTNLACALVFDRTRDCLSNQQNTRGAHLSRVVHMSACVCICVSVYLCVCVCVCICVSACVRVSAC